MKLPHDLEAFENVIQDFVEVAAWTQVAHQGSVSAHVLGIKAELQSLQGALRRERERNKLIIPMSCRVLSGWCMRLHIEWLSQLVAHWKATAGREQQQQRKEKEQSRRDLWMEQVNAWQQKWGPLEPATETKSTLQMKQARGLASEERGAQRTVVISGRALPGWVRRAPATNTSDNGVDAASSAVSSSDCHTVCDSCDGGEERAESVTECNRGDDEEKEESGEGHTQPHGVQQQQVPEEEDYELPEESSEGTPRTVESQDEVQGKDAEASDEIDTQEACEPEPEEIPTAHQPVSQHSIQCGEDDERLAAHWRSTFPSYDSESFFKVDFTMDSELSKIGPNPCRP